MSWLAPVVALVGLVVDLGKIAAKALADKRAPSSEEVEDAIGQYRRRLADLDASTTEERAETDAAVAEAEERLKGSQE